MRRQNQIENQIENSIVVQRAVPYIGTMREKSLHAALKAWYSQPGDKVEEKVEGYYIDICRRDLLIEIQTRSFSSMRKKLADLVPLRPVRLVHPIALEKWILRVGHFRNTFLSRRKSPKRGRLMDLFGELVSFPTLILHPNFSLEVLLVREEEERCDDGQGSRRRKGVSIRDHRLLEVVERVLFQSPRDFRKFLPAGWIGPSSNRELAELLQCPCPKVQKMTYCLSRMGVLEQAGKRGNSHLFQFNSHAT